MGSALAHRHFVSHVERRLLRLHKKMFGDVWKWAGTIRERETNIGVPPDEIAIRLHYRVVTIHPFPNGNGRQARMLAHMVMVRHFGLNPLSWGVNALRSQDGNRKAYIALKEMVPIVRATILGKGYRYQELAGYKSSSMAKTISRALRSLRNPNKRNK